MKKTGTHSKNSLFLIEMIFVLLFLALSSAACIRIFAVAKENMAKAQERRHIQMLTTSVGEILEGSHGNEDAILSRLPDGTVQNGIFEWYYDRSWNSCSASQAVYQMTLKLAESSCSIKGTLSFNSYPDSAIIYEIDLAFPVITTSDEEVAP